MIKIDLHVHSIASKDGSLTEPHFRRFFDQRLLDVIAITDHNRIDYAQRMAAIFGQHIIVGEEIQTSEGEIIGLYLREAIAPGQDLKSTIAAIKQQGGIVYVPHPFVGRRHSLNRASIEANLSDIDIIEVHNGRSINKLPSEAVELAGTYEKAESASSDAHNLSGLGLTYNRASDWPNPQTLVSIIDQAHFEYAKPPLKAVLGPKYNRVMHALGLQKVSADPANPSDQNPPEAPSA